MSRSKGTKQGQRIEWKNENGVVSESKTKKERTMRRSIRKDQKEDEKEEFEEALERIRKKNEKGRS